MKLVIDRIEEKIAVCQDLETGKIQEIDIKLLPKEIREGSILNSENDHYSLDLALEHERRQNIRDRFKRLKKN